MRENETIVRTVPMNKEDSTRMRTAMRLSASVHNRLQQIINDLIEESALRDSEAWDLIAKLAGYTDMDAVLDDGFSLRVEWKTREIQVIKRD